MIQRAVANSASYAGLGSQITDDMATKADILAGANTIIGGTATVSMQWRHPTLNESSVAFGGTPTSPPLPAAYAPLISDVLSLSGMGTSGSPTHTDPFALQMTYNQTLLGAEAIEAADGSIYLGWLNPTGGVGSVPLWQNAVLGDTGNNATLAEQNFQGSFATFQTAHGTNLSNYVGAWGVDTSSHQVWAVVNHNSDFAVVPEPGSLLLAALGVIGLAATRRFRR
jgi:hypothetical protein